jgi:hypothetical protein
MLRPAALLRRGGGIARRASSVRRGVVGGGSAAATTTPTTTTMSTTTTTAAAPPSSLPSPPPRRSMGGVGVGAGAGTGTGGSDDDEPGGGSGWGESIPEEYVEPAEETEGEWEGCYLKFLAPITVGSRGVGEKTRATTHRRRRRCPSLAPPSPVRPHHSLPRRPCPLSLSRFSSARIFSLRFRFLFAEK